MNSQERNQLLGKFHALLKESGLTHEKENILAGQGVSSSRDLTRQQFEEVFKYLEGMAKKRHEVPAEVKTRRSKVLALLTDLGILRPGSQPNWQKVNDFLRQPRIAGKLLYELDAAELDVLIRKLHLLVRERTRKIEVENRLAQLN